MSCKMGRPKKPVRIKKRDNGIFYVKVEGHCEFKSTGCKRKSDAERIGLSWYNKRKEVDDRRKEEKLTLNFYAKDFFTEQSDYIINQRQKGRSQSASHIRNRQALLDNYILPKFGNMKLNQISAKNIDDWLLTVSLSNQSKNHIISTLKSIFDFAVYSSVIEINQLQKLAKYANNSKVRDTFTASEINILFPSDNYDKAIKIWGDKRWTSFFTILAYTGARLGEVRALRWSDISISNENCFISINKSLDSKNNVGSTKTGEIGLGYIPKFAYIWLMKYKELIVPLSSDSFLFTQANKEKPISNETANKAFKRALVRSQINVENRNIVPHSFRHTFVTLMRNGNISTDVVKCYTQHKNLKTMDRYTHKREEDLLKLISTQTENIDKAFKG